MNFTALFIRRPVMTTLVMATILVFGVMAYQQLPVSDLPNVDYPTITVSAGLPGASAETMASAVATPLEKQFTTIAGIDNMVSTSGLGSTSITIQFALDRSIDAAAQDIQSAISKTMRDLPPGIVPPSMNKSNPADEPILYLNLRSPTLPLSTLDEIGQTIIGQRLSMVNGVAQVTLYGTQKYATRIQLDPRALAARGIGIDEVASAISQNNVNLPTGVLWGKTRAYTLQANGQLSSAKEFGEVIVAYRNGAPVRLKDLGDVRDDVQNNRIAAWYNGTRSITVAVQKQPGTNTVEVADAINAMMPRIREQLPAAVELSTFYDRSVGIRASVHDVKLTLVLTLSLVVLVIFLFLRNIPATLIPSLALPMSVVGTFAVMWVLGYSLDNLSLMALTLAVGFVVDDAIVMLENIVRHVEMGKTPLNAALDGAKEVGFTILSMTLSLTAVFIPILFMGGLIGRLFHEFAVTIAAAILVSGLVSVTLTPMLGARFLRRGKHEEHAIHNWLLDGFERGYEATHRMYGRTLRLAMAHRPFVMAFSALTLLGTVGLYILIPKGFIPSEDTGRIRGSTEAAQGTSFEGMVEKQKQAAALALKNPYVEAVLSNLGTGGGNSVGLANQGRLSFALKDRSERPKADAMVRILSKELNTVPGLAVYLQNTQALNIGARSAKALYQYTLQGSDLELLYTGARALEKKMKALPALTDVSTDLLVANPQASVLLDRDRAAQYGVTPEQVEGALYNAYGSRQVSTIYTPNNEYWVILELLPEFQRDLSALELMYVRSKTGTLVPLSSVTTVTTTVGPTQVNHTGQVPSVTLSFNLAAGASLGEAVAQVEAASRESLPEGITTGFSGTAAAFQATQQGLGILFIVAIFVIYVVLGILYESFIHPITILSGIPFAAFGALLAMLVTRTELTMYAWVGVIMLVGLVKKNGIMMIDFAIEAERQKKSSATEAIIEACLVRFRPIMMTTMAALVGTLPIALGTGVGAESRRPLGIAVVGGLAFSQLVTLYVTPVVYTYFDEWGRKWRRAPAMAEAPTPAPAQIPAHAASVVAPEAAAAAQLR